MASSITFHATTVGELASLLAGLDPATPLAFAKADRPHFCSMAGFLVARETVRVPNSFGADDFVPAVMFELAEPAATLRSKRSSAA